MLSGGGGLHHTPFSGLVVVVLFGVLNVGVFARSMIALIIFAGRAGTVGSKSLKSLSGELS